MDLCRPSSAFGSISSGLLALNNRLKQEEQKLKRKEDSDKEDRKRKAEEDNIAQGKPQANEHADKRHNKSKSADGEQENEAENEGPRIATYSDSDEDEPILRRLESESDDEGMIFPPLRRTKEPSDAPVRVVPAQGRKGQIRLLADRGTRHLKQSLNLDLLVKVLSFPYFGKTEKVAE